MPADGEDGSEPQIAQVVVTDLDAFKRGPRFVVLDEVVPDAGLCGIRENAWPVDAARADVGETAARTNRTECALVTARNSPVVNPVLHVHQREAAGISVEVRDRILPRGSNPTEIQFH